MIEIQKTTTTNFRNFGDGDMRYNPLDIIIEINYNKLYLTIQIRSVDCII